MRIYTTRRKLQSSLQFIVSLDPIRRSRPNTFCIYLQVFTRNGDSLSGPGRVLMQARR